ncbi:MAG: cobalamin B12-binding domain-containing protein [Bacillota bacterium]
MFRDTEIDVAKLPDVSQQAADDYINNKKSLLKMVNDKLAGRKDIEQLIGDNSMDKMFANHENHFLFMKNVFKLNAYQLLVRTIPWVYKTYSAQGFAYEYFSIELKKWIEAVDMFLEPDNALLINEVYSFLLENHEKFIKLSQRTEYRKFNISGKWEKVNDSFFSALMDGDEKTCIKLAEDKVNSQKEVTYFFEQVITPAMYKVGNLWEEGEISVAEEHLASSMMSQVLFSLYSDYMSFEKSRGQAVITAIANEYHEIGSRIIADSLELDGWDVRHLGADTPISELIDYLIQEKPFLLGLSVSVSFNLLNVVETINRIRDNSKIDDLKILVGGKLFNDNPELWKKTGADAWAQDSSEAQKIARRWWEEREE